MFKKAMRVNHHSVIDNSSYNGFDSFKPNRSRPGLFYSANKSETHSLFKKLSVALFD